MTAHKFSKKSAICFVILILSLMVFSACQDQNAQAEKVETVTYQNVTGYEITIPKDWQMVKQTASGGVYFLSTDKHISLDIFSEIGGMNYLDPEEISQSVFKKLTGAVAGAKVVEVLPVSDESKEYRQLIQGKDASGNPLMLDVWLNQPMDGMRYYTVLSCGGDDYEKNVNSYDDVIKSFKIDLSQDEIFSLFTLSEDELAKKLTDGMKMAD